MQIYKSVSLIAADIAKEGISKDRKNVQQGYSFRGIDDIYNALAPILAKHEVVIFPRMVSRNVVERQTAKGGALFYVTIEAEFDFVSAVDASKHTVKTFGEAMDSGDKATNKAMSAAYKYAAFQTFCIPTEGENDADSTTHEVAYSAPTQTLSRPALSAPKPPAPVAANKEPGSGDLDVNECAIAMRDCENVQALKKVFGDAWLIANQEQKPQLKAAYDAAKSLIEKGA